MRSETNNSEALKEMKEKLKNTAEELVNLIKSIIETEDNLSDDDVFLLKLRTDLRNFLDHLAQPK